LFLRDDQGTRIRHISLNNPDTAPHEIKELLPGLGEASLVPYYAYLSVGAVYCMFAVFRIFHEARVALELKSSRTCTWPELRQSNLILVGNTAVNSHLDALQGDGNFVLGGDFVRNLDPHPGEESTYRGERYMDGKLARHKEYAVVTRRPGLGPGTVITMIGALNGKAHEGAGHFFTSEDTLQGLLERLQPNPREALPDYFQVLVEVDMIDIADEVIDVKCVAHRTVGVSPGVNVSSVSS
jgi:hypothetical protein